MTTPHGRDGHFVWSELLTTDPEAGVQFYQSVLGWTSGDAGLHEPYTLVKAQGMPVGGAMALPEEMVAQSVPPHWLAYLRTSEIGGTLAAIKDHGGAKIWGPEPVENVGTIAVAADPQGATFGLLQPLPDAPSPPLPAPGTAGHAGWHELQAAEGQSAFRFYAEVFGWTQGQSVDMGAQGLYQTFHTGDAWAGGVMTKLPSFPHPIWIIYFTVESASAAAARVTGAGGIVLAGPMAVPGGSFVVQARDPQGAVFALVARQ